jgi:hypothetical protein
MTLYPLDPMDVRGRQTSIPVASDR